MIALYLRLSRENEDSIRTQRALLLGYLREHPEFDGIPVEEFVDDGFSGTRSDRPGFTRMLEQIRAGRIRYVLVKDISRFSRDYIRAGECLEELFPLLGVRFLSASGDTGEDLAFRAILADLYSRDVSRKQRSSRTVLAREGKFVSARPIYGYRRDPADRHRLVPDSETAPTVAQIYRLKLAGLSGRAITRLLNSAAVPSPTGGDWEPGKVLSILKDERYAGNMISLKRSRKGIWGQTEAADPLQWVRVEHTHSPIVSYETFLKTQQTLLSVPKARPLTVDRQNLWQCGFCGRRLSRTRDGKKRICRHGEVTPGSPCEGAVYEEGSLLGAVDRTLHEYLDRQLPWKRLLDRVLTARAAREKLRQLSVSRLEKQLAALYTRCCTGSLSEEAFLEKKQDLAQRLKGLRAGQALPGPPLPPDPRQAVLALLAAGYPELPKALRNTFCSGITVFGPDRIRLSLRSYWDTGRPDPTAQPDQSGALSPGPGDPGRE